MSDGARPTVGEQLARIADAIALADAVVEKTQRDLSAIYARQDRRAAT